MLKQWKWLTPLRVEVDKMNQHLLVRYKGRTKRVYFDICDSTGKIMRTGQINGAIARLDLQGLKPQEYVLLLLDGHRIRKKSFDYQGQS